MFYSITMTTVSTTLGLGMMPLLLFIYSFAFDSNLRVPFDTIGKLKTQLCQILVFQFVCVFRNFFGNTSYSYYSGYDYKNKETSIGRKDSKGLSFSERNQRDYNHYFTFTTFNILK